MQEQERLRDILENFCDEFLPELDCDGCTRLVGFLLASKNIDFEIYSGKIVSQLNPVKIFPIHYWIKTKDGILFDFKTKKWIGVTSDKTNYQSITKLDKNEFLSVGGNQTIIMGVLLQCGMNKNKL